MSDDEPTARGQPCGCGDSVRTTQCGPHAARVLAVRRRRPPSPCVPHLCEVCVLLRGPDRPVLRRLDVRSALGGRRGEQGRHRLRGSLAVVRVTGHRHDRGHRPEAVGELDGHHLHDHPAHRGAGNVGLLDTEVIEQGDAVGRHVGERVGHRWQRLAREGCRHDGRGIDCHTVELRGQSAVAVVVPDDEVALVREALAELLVPRRELSREAHHQQQGRIVLGPKGLVLDLDPCRYRCACHGVPRVSVRPQGRSANST